MDSIGSGERIESNNRKRKRISCANITWISSAYRVTAFPKFSQLIQISGFLKRRNAELHLHNARNTMCNSGLQSVRSGVGNEIARCSPVMTTPGRRVAYRFHDNDVEKRSELPRPLGTRENQAVMKFSSRYPLNHGERPSRSRARSSISVPFFVRRRFSQRISINTQHFHSNRSKRGY